MRWNEIKGYEGSYFVSDCGSVKSIDRKVKTKSKLGRWSERTARGRVLRPLKGRGGYLLVDLKGSGRRRNMAKIHRLVAEAFIPNDQKKAFVNHIDGNPSNNHVDNLEWCTHQENMRHAADTGLIKNFNPARGERSNFSKLNESQAKEIKLRIKRGEPPKSIAQDYPVGESCIKEIKAGRSWSAA